MYRHLADCNGNCSKYKHIFVVIDHQINELSYWVYTRFSLKNYVRFVFSFIKKNLNLGPSHNFLFLSDILEVYRSPNSSKHFHLITKHLLMYLFFRLDSLRNCRWSESPERLPNELSSDRTSQHKTNRQLKDQKLKRRDCFLRREKELYRESSRKRRRHQSRSRSKSPRRKRTSKSPSRRKYR